MAQAREVREAGPEPLLTPFEIIGGTARVQAMVDRFYDLMETEPAYAALRALHAADLAPMRLSLAGFLTGWLGGPRSWFERPSGGTCIMSLHGRIAIDAASIDQWTRAMRQAMADTGVPPELAVQMDQAFTRMAGGMRNR